MNRSDRNDTPTTLDNLLSELEQLLARVGEQGSQRYRDASGELQRKMRRARDHVDDAHYSTLREARLAARQADHYVHENPWRTAGAAAAVGAVVGALIVGWLLYSSRRND